jgi:hypothetical protein
MRGCMQQEERPFGGLFWPYIGAQIWYENEWARPIEEMVI